MEKRDRTYLLKEDTDWVRDNMLFNYCLGDDDSFLIESFVHNNDIPVHFNPDQFYFCITGVDKKYNEVNTAERFHESRMQFISLVEQLLRQTHQMNYEADICLLKIDNSKQLGIVYSPKENPLCTARQIAEDYDYAFADHFPKWRGLFVTSMSGPYSGYEQLNQAFLHTRELNDMEFFDLRGQVITDDLVQKKAKPYTVSVLMTALRKLRYEMCTSSPQICMRQVRYIFRNLLGPSFSMMYVVTAYAYLEDLFSMFEKAYPGRVQVAHRDTDDMEYLRDMEQYVQNNVAAILRQLEGTRRYSPRMILAVSYICNDPGEDLSVSALAEHVGMSAVSFSSMFRSETGMSAPEFVARERIRRACRLLKTTDKTVGEIAEETGFTTIQYFRKTFRKYAGMTASEYREGNLP